MAVPLLTCVYSAGCAAALPKREIGLTPMRAVTGTEVLIATVLISKFVTVPFG